MTGLLVPLTMACLLSAARHYAVPPVVLEAIRVVENGETGASRRNANGTRDLGAFQINSSWIRPLRQKGVRVSFSRLRDNGCVNVFVAAYILSREERRAPRHSLRIAIGHYHSHRPVEARKYRARVMEEIAWLRRHTNTPRGQETSDGRNAIDGRY